MTIAVFTALWLVGFLLVVTSSNRFVYEISLPAISTPSVGSPLRSTSLPAGTFKPSLCSSSLTPISCAVTRDGVVTCPRCQERYPILSLILELRRRFLGCCAVVGSWAKSRPAVTRVPRYVSPITRDFIIQTLQIFRPNKLTPGDRILLFWSAASSYLPD